MPGRDVAIDVFLASALRAATPALAVVALLWIFGPLGFGGAFAGAVLAFVAGAIVAAVRHRDLARMTAFVESLGPGPAPPAVPDGLDWPMRRLATRWADREARLAAEALGHRQVLDLLADPVLQVGAGPAIVAANRAAAELLGDGLAGRPLEAVLRDPGVLDAVGEVLAGAARRDVEVTLPGGFARAFLCRVSALQEPAADGTRAVMSLQDLTQAKRMEAMRVDFVANASHEIRTPLAALSGYIETLQGPARDDAPARDRFLAIMADQVTRMTRLVSDLLSLSRIELNEHSPPSGTVDLGPVLARVARGLDWKATGKSMALVVEAAPDLPPALGDASELEQVFQNLLDNAIKYGAAGTEVTVTARKAERVPPGLRAQGDAGLVAVAVTDRGAGIAREHLPRLTERFYRVDAARSRDMGGTGLGLAIVKHIVNRHRGALTIESEPGQGSTFTVVLPAADGAAAAAPAPAVEAALADGVIEP